MIDRSKLHPYRYIDKGTTLLVLGKPSGSLEEFDTLRAKLNFARNLEYLLFILKKVYVLSLII